MVYVASLATQSLHISYGCSPSRFKIFLFLLRMVLTGFSNSFMTNTATLLSRPWSLSSAGTALHYEQHPLRGPSAILLWLFSLVCYYGIPFCLSVWRRDWWNVGKFLQWFLFDFSKSLFTFELFWLINFLRSISVSVLTILMPRALLVATSSSSNAGKAVPTGAGTLQVRHLRDSTRFPAKCQCLDAPTFQ